MQLSWPVKLPCVYVPGRQVAGMEKAEPAGQYRPTGQSLHALLPRESSYLPSTHVSHNDMPSRGAALARPQAAGETAPVMQ